MTAWFCFNFDENGLYQKQAPSGINISEEKAQRLSVSFKDAKK